MNSHWLHSLAGLAAAAVLSLVTAGPAGAIDRRFELDTGVLDRKSEPAPKAKSAAPSRKARRKPAAPKAPPSVALPPPTAVMERPAPAGGGVSFLKMAHVARDEGMATVQYLWERLIPGAPLERPLELRADNFTLELDPNRYQVLPAANGGKIIIDGGRTLPPLIRSLIQEKDPGIRIVSERPEAGKRFYTQLLQAAGFYSVEPEYSMEYGSDPKLVVRADFRIERTSESLLNQETVLLYTAAGRYLIPESLKGFLGREGFQVVEPDLPLHDPPKQGSRFIRVARGTPFQVADTVLGTLNLEAEAGKTIAFTGWAREGISLSVAVDRTFEYRGRRYVLAAYNGNPVTYTLIRLLETEGMTVVVFGPDDDFRAVTQKLLYALKVPASYDSHQLWPLRETPYTVQMSGFFLREPASGGSIFLTDREPDPLIYDLIERNGFDVTAR